VLVALTFGGGIAALVRLTDVLRSGTWPRLVLIVAWP
jgi:hypothetical protein